MYPQGASPYGVFDLTGNVLEWNLTKWRGSYREPEVNDPEGDAARMMRGGAWYP
jgi:formylglycine-generating enzyme required for sulfatase activity